jgi:HEAT repeat protein
VRTLGEIGPKAKPAVPVLAELLKDKDGDVRKAAAEALEEIRMEKK